MWLINVHTKHLEEVWVEEVKEYAILSHRWQDDEITFKDMQNPDAAAERPQFSKIAGVCELAGQDGYGYVWVDTCCINKSSSAELTEAINSMFRWYKAAAVCYAFLCDVDVDRLRGGRMDRQITNSVWFDRGWTLQELLAPANVVFYDRHWRFLGTKQSLIEALVRRTGIQPGALNGESLSTFSIAQPMSWAAHRVTTRREDIAYSLLGIFDVNMPMLYGEGYKAFIRLQEEIIKQSNDHTIFAWPIQNNNQFSLLATSPVAFKDCHRTRTLISRTSCATYSVTNGGISGRFQALPYVPDTYIVKLNCTNEPAQEDIHPHHQRQVCIFLRMLVEADQYARVSVDGQSIVHEKALNWDDRASAEFDYEEHYDAEGRFSYGDTELSGPSGFPSDITINDYGEYHATTKRKPEFAHSFNQREPGDRDGCMRPIDPKFDHVFDKASQPGIWAIRGDRISGIHVQLQSSLAKVGYDPRAPSIRIVRGEIDGKLIWDVYLKHELKGSDIRPMPLKPVLPAPKYVDYLDFENPRNGSREKWRARFHY
ncbi:MAG: hypothetical protein Q9169_006995 [Polycauliona sp. 2 TL-2023]